MIIAKNIESGQSYTLESNPHHLRNRTRLLANWVRGARSEGSIRPVVIYDFGGGKGIQASLLAAELEQRGLDFSIVVYDPMDNPIPVRIGPGGATSSGEKPEKAGADYVLSLDVIEHVRDLDPYFAEIHRLLKDDGRLLVMVPNRCWPLEQHGLHLFGAPLFWQRLPLISWLPPILHGLVARSRIYSRRSIRRELHNYGFQVLHSEYMTAPLDVLGGSIVGRLWRYLFHNPTTRCPFLATNIFVVAARQN